MFKGQFEKITESTLTRYQQGGIMAGDIVKINDNALKHEKIKDMPENMKENIKMLMATDLHLAVTAVTSTWPSQGGMGDGLGLGATTAPTGFWVSVAVLHSPGFKGDPIALPIEILERQDFGANLPPVPDSLKHVTRITIKPEDASEYKTRMGEGVDPVYESLEDVYDDTVGNTYPCGVPLKSGKPNPEAGLGANFGKEEAQVAVRVPLEPTEELKVTLDDAGIGWSIVGDNRIELHGTMGQIQPYIQEFANQCGCELDVEVVEEPIVGIEAPVAPEKDEIGHKALPMDVPPKNDEEGLEEAYGGIHGGVSIKGYTIEVATAFAENLVQYLATENINHEVAVEGGKTLVGIRSKATAEDLTIDIQKNVMGDMTYLKVYEN